MLISTLLYVSIIWIGNHQLEDQDKDHLDGRLTTIVITDSLSKTKMAFWKNCNVYTTWWKTFWNGLSCQSQMLFRLVRGSLKCLNTHLQMTITVIALCFSTISMFMKHLEYGVSCQSQMLMVQISALLGAAQEVWTLISDWQAKNFSTVSWHLKPLCW